MSRSVWILSGVPETSQTCSVSWKKGVKAEDWVDSLQRDEVQTGPVVVRVKQRVRINDAWKFDVISLQFFEVEKIVTGILIYIIATKTVAGTSGSLQNVTAASIIEKKVWIYQVS